MCARRMPVLFCVAVFVLLSPVLAGAEIPRLAKKDAATQLLVDGRPFGIESVEPNHPLVSSYEILRQFMPLIVERHGSDRMAGILQQDAKEEGTTIDLPGYRANVRYNRGVKDPAEMSHGLILQLSPDEFLVAGNWFSVNFSPRDAGPRHAGILQVWEGRYERGQWRPGRCLNGDETAAHWQAKLPPNDADLFAGSTQPRILRVTLYRHD